jgi:hypothetical protein
MIMSRTQSRRRRLRLRYTSIEIRIREAALRHEKIALLFGDIISRALER